MNKNYIYFSLILLEIIIFVSFPPIMVHDSGGYYQLSQIIFSDRFWTEWNFHRQPLFPFLLRCSFYIFGESANSIKLIPFFFGIMGIFYNYKLASFYIRNQKIRFSLLFFIAVHPYTIIFQNSILLESGIFAFLSAIVFYSIQYLKAGKSVALFKIGIFGALGYYLKSPILFFSLFSLLSLAVVMLFKKKNAFRPLLTIALSIILLFALVSPWKFHPRIKANETIAGKIDILQGLIAQGVVSDTYLNKIGIKNEYDNVFKEYNQSGVFQADGFLSVPGFYDLLAAQQKFYTTKTESVLLDFFTIIVGNFDKYCKGIKNNILLFSHLSPGEGGATLNLYGFLLEDLSRVDVYEPDPEWIKETVERFQITIKGDSFIRNIFVIEVSIFRFVIPILFFHFFLRFVFSLFHGRILNLYFYMLTFVWVLFFLLPLSGQERYIVPVTGFFTLALFISFEKIYKLSRKVIPL
ncbi:glycosyltransferase family 39 protein [Leptospira jelokensis]|uniref:glycosyltransferase family 39 protein n=1 Tax=Leptospira jelokensis TaxID=2484931 RepID=UPI0010912A4B|nr:glycosyltransferase family 39 protein [Leptospira jelokensis]TGL99218.1 hypothetical protein EHQ79_15500 [Leptospira jelokensis]